MRQADSDSPETTTPPLPPRARELLKSVFGYDDFRPGQTEAIARVAAGEPLLAVMPTGSGKSMCYQLPALLGAGLTVVVSPLIALMRDQVSQMLSLGVGAATLNSLGGEAENQETWRRLRAGEIRLLFISPERLAMDGLRQSLRRVGVERIAVDEAHCVSEWGHDFRPEYREIRAAVAALGNPPVLALTATADRNTRADIVERLFDNPPAVIVHSFDRPNIDLAFAAKDQPRRQLSDFLDRHRGQNGIVYCSSRARAESLADHFKRGGHEAFCYHAGMDQGERNRNQDRFQREDGVVAVATVAFGMGINKPDVRFVAHADMPSSVEAYYQEIGRAGRDGLPAFTLTLYGVEDMALRRRQIGERDVNEARRGVEMRRLDALIGLCEASACRRQTLLAYFDEESTPCGSCDVCMGRVSLFDGTVDAQKVLSAVVRTGQRFGAAYLADVLVGQASEQVTRNGHAAIKTFGVGRDKARQVWIDIVRQLFAAGALATASEEHGGFALSPKGDDILRGRQTIQLRESAPRRERGVRKAGAAPRGALADGDDALLAALKTLRREVARDEGVAAFMVFPDRTLLDMIEKRPATLDEMSLVHGVGERKLKRYGAAFLEALAGGS
jgi:ATP-dependent DNA helicase RecQ